MSLSFVNVQQNTIRQIDDKLEDNSTLNLIIDKLVNSTFKGGVSVFFKVGNEKIPLSKQGNDVMKTYWLPFARKHLKCLLLYGMTPVIIRPDHDDNGNAFFYPVVPNKGTFGFGFEIDDYGQANFSVTKLISTPTIGNSKTDLNNIWKDSYVLRTQKYECSMSGALTSPVTIAFKDLKRIDEIWQMYMSTSYSLAHPPYIYKIPAEQKDVQSLINNITGSDFDTAGEEKTEIEMTEKRTKDLENAIESSQQLTDKFDKTGNDNMRKICNDLTSGYDSVKMPIDECEKNRKPWTRCFFSPPGWDINANFPKVQSPTDFLGVLKFIISTVVNSFQISDQIAENTKRTNTGSSFTQEQFNDLIKSYQTIIKEDLETLLNKVNKDIQKIITKGSMDFLNLLEGIPPQQISEILSNISFEFVFNDEPSFDVKEIMALFKEGLIPKEVAQRRILPKFNIDPEECIGCANESIKFDPSKESDSEETDEDIKKKMKNSADDDVDEDDKNQESKRRKKDGDKQKQQDKETTPVESSNTSIVQSKNSSKKIIISKSSDNDKEDNDTVSGKRKRDFDERNNSTKFSPNILLSAHSLMNAIKKTVQSAEFFKNKMNEDFGYMKSRLPKFIEPSFVDNNESENNNDHNNNVNGQNGVDNDDEQSQKKEKTIKTEQNVKEPTNSSEKEEKNANGLETDENIDTQINGQNAKDVAVEQNTQPVVEEIPLQPVETSSSFEEKTSDVIAKTSHNGAKKTHKSHRHKIHEDDDIDDKIK